MGFTFTAGPTPSPASSCSGCKPLAHVSLGPCLRSQNLDLIRIWITAMNQQRWEKGGEREREGDGGDDFFPSVRRSIAAFPSSYVFIFSLKFSGCLVVWDLVKDGSIAAVGSRFGRGGDGTRERRRGDRGRKDMPLRRERRRWRGRRPPVIGPEQG